MQYIVQIFFFAWLLLILFGDVELKPGPFSSEEAKKVSTMLEILPKIDKGKDVLLDELAAIEQKQVSVGEKLETLSDTLQTVQSELET